MVVFSGVTRLQKGKPSMSTSLLYHAFGVRGYQHVCTDFRQGQVEFTVRQESDTLRCSACGSDQLIRRGQVIRRFKTLPIGGRPVTIVLPIQRVACQVCDEVRQVRVVFADTQKTYTRSFERYAAVFSWGAITAVGQSRKARRSLWNRKQTNRTIEVIR